jgi:hypothetical protein
MSLMSRAEFNQKYSYLSSQEIAKASSEINGIVIDEVTDTRYQRKSWDVQGAAPLNTSSIEYARPVAQVRCALDPSQPKGLGYSIRFAREWFAD